MQIIKVDLCMKHLPPPYATYSDNTDRFILHARLLCNKLKVVAIYKVLLCRGEGEHPTSNLMNYDC